MKPIFEAYKVNKQFAHHRALTDLDISIAEGGIFGLLGPNGAGKTTFIRIINQITAPDSGELLFNGRPLQASDVHQIGYLPEERGLYKKMKVGEQAIYLAQLKGISKQDAKKKLKYWFEKFEIMTWWNKKVEELSKGMQQKIQFIITIIHEPRLLIFDEPFSGFDPINVNLLKEEILNLQQKGSTVIFSTHNMASVEELCDHIALIDNSHKILDGKVSEIRNQYKSNTFEVSFIGDPDKVKLINSSDYKVEIGEHQDGLSTARIQLLQTKDQNELIGQLLPLVKINSFTEILPSMNDIFISRVKKNGKHN
jgi:ABC-2 type transport system ATP-binding protein